MAAALANSALNPPTSGFSAMTNMAMAIPMVMNSTCIMLAAATDANPPIIV